MLTNNCPNCGSNSRQNPDSGPEDTDIHRICDSCGQEYFTDRNYPENKMNDPWIHRSKGMACVTCMWYNPKQSRNGEVVLGRCRRHAPTMSGFPVMFPTDWCGDHKLDENEINGDA